MKEIIFDTTITPELKKEGKLREFVRVFQDLRKRRLESGAKKLCSRQSGKASQRIYGKRIRVK